jgi:hypothetical protein
MTEPRAETFSDPEAQYLADLATAFESDSGVPPIHFFAGQERDLLSPVAAAVAISRAAGWLVLEDKIKKGESLWSFTDRFFRLSDEQHRAATSFGGMLYQNSAYQRSYAYEEPTIAYARWAQAQGFKGLMFVFGGTAGVKAGSLLEQIQWKIFNAAISGARVSAIVKCGPGLPGYVERHGEALGRVAKIYTISPKQVRVKSDDKFAFEADMLYHLSGQGALLAGVSSETPLAIYYEIPTTGTVNDLVIAQWDEAAVAAREASGIGPISNYTYMRIITGLAGVGAADLITTAKLGWISPGYAKSVILSKMIKGGLIRKRPDGQYELAFAWRPLTRRMTSVEAKRSDWGKAHAQLANCYSFADRCVVALDRAHTRAAQKSDFFVSPTEIGLAALDAVSGKLEILVEPQENVTKRAFETGYIAELLYVLRRAGVNSYPYGKVFGVELTAPNDPRAVLPLEALEK